MNQSQSWLSVIILTKDEELVIERCIKSVQWADEVLVLDSGSSDRTQTMARDLGATVYYHEWLGYAKQRNKATELAKYDWVFFVDADEMVSPELRASVEAVMNAPKHNENGYSMARRGDFMGILLPDASPPWRKLNFIRIFNRRFNRFDPDMRVHESVKLCGKAVFIKGDLLHLNGHTLYQCIADINRYSEIEAEVLYAKEIRPPAFIIPVRVVLRFIWCYVICREFLLGARGFLHSLLAAMSEYIRYAKLWEKWNTTQAEVLVNSLQTIENTSHELQGATSNAKTSV